MTQSSIPMSNTLYIHQILQNYEIALTYIKKCDCICGRGIIAYPNLINCQGYYLVITHKVIQC